MLIDLPVQMDQIYLMDNNSEYYASENPTYQESSLNQPSSGPSHYTREKRDPSITPRKFRRFFTPRHTASKNPARVSSARQAFINIRRSITTNNEKETIKSCPSRQFCYNSGVGDDQLDTLLPVPKRRRYNSPELSPCFSGKRESQKSIKYNTCDYRNDVRLSSPCERATRLLREIRGKEDGEEQNMELKLDLNSMEVEDGNETQNEALQKTILPLRTRGLTGQLIERELGITSRCRQKFYTYPQDFQDHTAHFYSKPNDLHISTSTEIQERVIPFCAVACNTNSLVAVGDEDGRVRLLEAGRIENSTFADVFLSFRVHQNAIIDMSLSDDDSRLVTASGDQSSRVVDMKTQTTISVLGAHTASLKQARFQPGSSNTDVIATSGRDGNIHIWDLRCRGYEKSLIEIQTPTSSRNSQEIKKEHFCAITSSIYNAHKPFKDSISAPGPRDAPTRGEAAGRIGDVSVTSIQFLSAEFNHLLLSSSEADSVVKLWDIRNIQTRHGRNQIPLSSTIQPRSHSKWRHFGISSMSISSDCSRLYTLCKDNTVYTYSTAHLMLGQAQELNFPDKVRRRLNRSTQEGLGPIYGLRNPRLHATTFYVKSAIRKPKEGKCEMLAVGSSDGCAVIFPTDERYISSEGPNIHLKSTSSRSDDHDIPIFNYGTALIRGHDREVGSLTWTSDGDLVTVGDDFLVRVWREGDEARNLRTGGEQEGRRWGCGWADVSDDYDVEDV
ncbi:Cell division cycle protein cdt2 [Erysiphe neolycopersici]|uniref:Cell division cycle protein cdt2 n=1 Tax=Erysiphe neolycopersici TaxID=212602 RepID=A0A420I546_9PEZI|nr:Cell division cycle protein cdt2 [Erysiphe neolycopersici]